MTDCTCATGHCACYGDDEATRLAERARQREASRLEWAVLDLLNGKPAGDASPRALELAALLAPHREAIVDVLAIDVGVYWWSHTGEQQEALVDSRRVRLVA
ncbi:hypothetical protein [Paraburkholderia sp. JPY419]|uniref:hypothetical protein n=1 Tax=Paraburkholderia sp. JPY419 TaxID=667660 RepID=UPI003D22A1FF